MIRNSDVLFGRLAATYKFSNKEIIRQSIKEASSLQALGIKKRMPQIMFERGFLKEDEICAIIYSLYKSKQIKKIRLLKTYLFTEKDDKKLYDYIGIPFNFELKQDKIVKLPKIVKEKNLPISTENLIICLNIKQSLERAGIKVFLLNIIYDKNLLNEKIIDIIGDIDSKKRVIINPKKIDEKKVRKSISLLFGQIGIVNNKLTKEKIEEISELWEKLFSKGIALRISEVMFYIGELDKESSNRISDFLFNISKIDQRPRLNLIRLSKEHEEYFDLLVKNQKIGKEYIDKFSKLYEDIKNEGLKNIRLSDIFIIKGLLTKKKIIQLWSKSRKKEIYKKVELMQLEKTEETKLIPEQDEVIFEEFQNTSDFIKEALADDSDEFEKELQKTFNNTQEKRKEEVQREIQLLKKRLIEADKEEAKTINYMIGQYEKQVQSLKYYVAALFVFLLMLAIATFYFYSNNTKKDDNKTYKKIVDKISHNKEYSQLEIETKLAKARKFIKNYRIDKAVETYKTILGSIKDTEQKKAIEDNIERIKIQLRLFKTLEKSLITSAKPLVISFREKPNTIVKALSLERGISLILPTDNRETLIPIGELTPAELYEIFKISGVISLYPWELALLCMDHDLVYPAREALAFYILQYPKQKDKACRLLGKHLNTSLNSIDYDIYKGRLYYKEEIKKIKENTVKISINKNEKTTKPIKKDNKKIDYRKKFNDFTILQNERITAVRKSYDTESKSKNYIFFNGRWTTPNTKIYEEEINLKRKQDKIFFQNKWFPRKELGNFCCLTLRKGEKARGFLKAKKGVIFIFRTEKGTRYLSKSQIIQRENVLSDWDFYWYCKENLSYKNIPGHLELGIWCFNNNLQELGRIHLEKVLMFDPENIAARFYLGYRKNKNRWADKQELFSSKNWINYDGLLIKKQELFKYGLELYNNKCISLYELGLTKWRRYQKSSKEYPFQFKYIAEDVFKLLSKTSSISLNYWKKGNFALLNKNHIKAYKYFNKALEKSNENPFFMVYKGLTYFYNANYSKSIEVLSKIIKNNENFALAYLLRARSFREKREDDKALKDLAKSLSLNSNNILTYYELIRLYISKGKLDEANSLAVKAAKTFNTDGELLLEETKNAIKSSAIKADLFIKGKNYIVKGNEEKKVAEVVALCLDNLREQFYKLLGMEEDNYDLFNIFLYNNEFLFIPYIKLEYFQFDKIGVYWKAKKEIILSTNHPLCMWKRTLFACAAEQLTDKYRYLPPWIKESIKIYFRETEMSIDKIKWGNFSEYLSQKAKVIIQKDNFSIEKLAQKEEIDFYSIELKDKNILKSFILFHFLVNAEQGAYLPFLKQYIGLIRKGKNLKYSWVNSIKKIENLDKKLNKYFKSLKQRRCRSEKLKRIFISRNP